MLVGGVERRYEAQVLVHKMAQILALPLVLILVQIQLLLLLLLLYWHCS